MSDGVPTARSILASLKSKLDFMADIRVVKDAGVIASGDDGDGRRGLYLELSLGNSVDENNRPHYRALVYVEFTLSNGMISIEEGRLATDMEKIQFTDEGLI